MPETESTKFAKCDYDIACAISIDGLTNLAGEVMPPPLPKAASVTTQQSFAKVPAPLPPLGTLRTKLQDLPPLTREQKKTYCRLFRILNNKFDLTDYALKHGNEWAKMQVSNLTVNAFLNANVKDRHRHLPPMTLKLFIQYRRAGLAIFARPKFHAANAGQQPIIRIDIDAHHGETDAEQGMAVVKELLPSVYCEPSTNGLSAYFFVENLPQVEVDTKIHCSTYAKRLEWMDTHADMIFTLQAGLTTIFRERGIQSPVEVFGAYTQVEKLDGKKNVVCRPSAVRLPLCPAGDADIDRLCHSRFDLAALQPIIACVSESTANKISEVKPAHVATVTNKYDMTQRASEILNKIERLERLEAADEWKDHHPGQRPPRVRTFNASRKIEDTGDKHRNRVRCASRAIKVMLGSNYDPETVMGDTIRLLVDEANSLYVENGFASGERDKARNDAFCHIIKWMLRTHGQPIANTDISGNGGGGSGIWFTLENDVPAAEAVVIDAAGGIEQLEAMIESESATCQAAPITAYILGLALCTITKNFATAANHACPSTAISGMLNHFGVRVNPAHVAAVKRILVRLRLTTMDKSYSVGHFATTYRPIGQTVNLPFIRDIELKPERATNQQAIEQTPPATPIQAPIQAPMLQSKNPAAGQVPMYLNAARDPALGGAALADTSYSYMKSVCGTTHLSYSIPSTVLIFQSAPKNEIRMSYEEFWRERSKSGVK